MNAEEFAQPEPAPVVVASNAEEFAPVEASNAEEFARPDPAPVKASVARSALTPSKSFPNLSRASSASSQLGRLKGSPYAASLSGSTSGVRRRWTPPPGAFNEPDLPPRFSTPGPGRYTPDPQHACLSTKPRIVACSFGSDDREKYFGGGLTKTTSGMLGSNAGRSSSSPGPVYKPSHSLVEPATMRVALSSGSTDSNSLRTREGKKSPGPAQYVSAKTNAPTKARFSLTQTDPRPAVLLQTPNFETSSRGRSYTSGGRFLQNDRSKYMGECDPASLTPSTKSSPGPIYNYSILPIKHNPGTVSFGGTGPDSHKKRPVRASESPGPGAYSPDAQLTVLSTNRRAPVSGFSVEPRRAATVDSRHCFHGRVPVDMRNGDTSDLSPGPCYYPNDALIHKAAGRAVFGTAKRFGPV